MRKSGLIFTSPVVTLLIHFIDCSMFIGSSCKMADGASGKNFTKVISRTVSRTKEKVLIFSNIYVSYARMSLTLNEAVTIEFLESLDATACGRGNLYSSKIHDVNAAEGKTTQSVVHCTITGPCLRMRHRHSARRVYR